MKLTDQQKQSVYCSESVLLEACPGSGKTRTLIAKLLHSVEEIRGTPRKICCITYTNAAVHEIEKRLRYLGIGNDLDYCDISTIHAFCLNNILIHFFWKLPEYRDGFRILPPDSEKFIMLAKRVCQDHNIPHNSLGLFEMLNRKLDGSPYVTRPLTEEAAIDFWCRLQKEQYIDFTNIVYLSYCLIERFPSIANFLACKYAWFLIDEFQDTTELQVQIFSKIARNKRSRFFMVGDSLQSIFSFSGARPQLMSSFAKLVDAKSDITLTGNFRSSPQIIRHAECMCARTSPMTAIGEAKIYTEQPQYHDAQNTFDAITDYFLPNIESYGISYGNAAILAPQWFQLYHLGRRLRDYGVPIVGPGARPYKRVHLYASLAEQLCAYIEESAPYLIRQIERELFYLLTNITGEPAFRVYTYNGRRTLFRILKTCDKLYATHEGGIQWLEHSAAKVSEILMEGNFLSESEGDFLLESVFDMKKDMIRNLDREALNNLTISELGIFASPERNLKLSTIHRAKGREFDAVAVIDVHDGRIPHWNARSEEQVLEERRKFYVAITRARRILMYITDHENRKNRPSPYIQEVFL